MMRFDGRALASSLRQAGAGANVTLLMMPNASSDEVVFHLPVVQSEYWRVRADTAERHAQLAVPAGAGWAAVGRSLLEQDSVPH